MSEFVSAVLFVVLANAFVAVSFVAVHFYSEARSAKAQAQYNSDALAHYRSRYYADNLR